MKKITIALMMLFASFGWSEKVQSQEVIDATTLNNKIMAGYQGWFSAGGDGSGVGWRHWGGNPPSAGSISIDMWPDMREYEPDELFPTDFFYADGSNAGLYSAYTPKTVDRHVKWMKDYGIDGVFVQRFIGNTLTIRDLRDRVLQNVRFASENYGRVFANMYDVSGGNPNTLVENIKNDWMHLVDDLKILESPNYLHHNGRPVLSIWGLGHREEFTLEQATAIVQWLTVDAPEKYLVTLKGGIDNKWQSHSAGWKALYEKFDVISPWAVGRYSDNNGADGFRENYIEPDLSRTKSKGIDYMPVVFPGFSWWNLKDDATFNSKPRNGGKFLWHQFYNAMDAGCNMVYVAMFDEVDEGTAIYKLAENNEQLPTTGKLLPLDYDGYDLPSDWYLRLTAEASKMLRNEINLTSTIPITATVSDAKIISLDVPTIMSPGATVSVSITVKNTGKTIWTKADGFKLGSQNAQDNTTWGANRIELNDDETIAPGENKIFTFDVKVPATQNVYNFRWRMMQEGVNWFGYLTANRLINVSNSVSFLDDCDALTDWNSPVDLTLYSSDKKQGANCLEFTGSNTDEYSKIFSTPYNSGISTNNAVLQFWYFISDASKLGTQNKVKLGSAGKANEDVYNWSLTGLSTGWNLISLKTNTAESTGSPDLSAINWFSITSTKTADVTTRIDEIQLIDMYASTAKYTLTVNSGKGSGSYIKNSPVNISADVAPAGERFDKWVVISGNPFISEPKSVNTSILVTDSNAEVAATYKATSGYLDDCDELTDWQDANYLTLNTTDKIQGEACLNFTGDKSYEFKKVFQTPYNPGIAKQNAVLQFWYYVADISKYESSNQVELGSAGKNDKDEFNWKLSNLKIGWNFISLKFSSASTMDNPDFNAINWFRIYHKKTGEISTKLDAVKIVDINTINYHALIVDNGRGTGTYNENHTASITANPAPLGMVFDSWIVNSGGATIADANSATTTLTMPATEAIVAATYKDAQRYALTVNSGSGSGAYNENQEVSITASPAQAGKEFDKWIVNSGEVTIADANAETTTLTMSANESTVTATYKDLPGYVLTVNSGSGSGTYNENQEITITADEAPAGQEFDTWIVNSGEVTITDANAETTTLKIGAIDASVTATYKDIQSGIQNRTSTKQEVNIYPNPLNGNLLSIDLIGFDNFNKIDVKISNLLGQTIYSNNIRNNKHLTIDTKGLVKAGIYIVAVKSGLSVINTKLVVE